MKGMVGTGIVGGTGAIAGAAFLAYAVRGRSAAVFGESVYRGERSQAAVALTFDDGPSESTPALLDVLDKYSVTATFFMCGVNVRRCAPVAREVHARGHEIGNHSDTHPFFQFKSPGFIYNEMARAQEAIQQATGVTPRWFRAPYGVRWFGVARGQAKLGLRGVMWTTIGRDYRWAAGRVEHVVVRHASNGAIFCLHDGRLTSPQPDIRVTIEAVERAIPRIRDRGLSFQTLTQMLGPRP
jgi:peptidoglycan/xylan/chitin deacetylase (PgdA/CDA1 family)